ncbi:hypothetical protein BHE74_00035870 [Ensete ventricosum]|nr:hypothetical protein GW17_00031993 [Ensete ventricosum]RWW57343.1 hypothetical protein BHE74_00035870 [Ensete ventricosum]RZR95332.1 hypothetical protein BHM03_00024157 [Ensete ventricosum]
MGTPLRADHLWAEAPPEGNGARPSARVVVRARRDGLPLVRSTVAGIGQRVKRCDDSVEIIVGPTMPWREITTHSDAARIR